MGVITPRCLATPAGLGKVAPMRKNKLIAITAVSLMGTGLLGACDFGGEIPELPEIPPQICDLVPQLCGPSTAL